MGHQNGQADNIPNIRYFRCGMGIANGSADFNAGRAVALQLGIGIVAQAAVTVFRANSYRPGWAMVPFMG